MKKTYNIPHSNYHIEYDTDKEWDYKIFRHNEDVTHDLKYNIISDMFYDILRLQSELNCAMKD